MERVKGSVVVGLRGGRDADAEDRSVFRAVKLFHMIPVLFSLVFHF